MTQEEFNKIPSYLTEGCSYCNEAMTFDNIMFLGGWADEFYHRTCWDQLSKRAFELNCGRDWAPVLEGGWKPIPPSKLNLTN